MPQETGLNPGALIQEAIRQERKQQQGLTGTNDLTQELKQNILAHGEIFFHGNDEPNVYTVIDERISDLHARNLLKTKWKLSTPTLIVVVYGSEIEISKRLTNTIKKGLWKAAESAGCWVVTDGLNIGIGKVCSEAVRDYTEAYGGDHMISIGITPTSRIEYYEMGQSEVRYPVLDPEQEALKPKELRSCNGFKLGKEVPSGILMDIEHVVRLSKDNNYMLFLECPEQHTKELYSEMYAQVRCKLESTIAAWRGDLTSTQMNQETTIPENQDLIRRPTIVLNTSSGSGAPGVFLTVKNPDNDPNETRRRSSAKRPSIVIIEDPNEKEEEPSVKLEPSQLMPGHKNSMNRSNSIRRGSLLLPSRNIEGSQLAPDSELYGTMNSQIPPDMVASPATNARVPICGLLGGGSQFTIHQIYFALKFNQCPIVVIRGSGGAADIICSVIDFINLTSNLDETLEDDEINMKIASLIKEGWIAGDKDMLETQRKANQTEEGQQEIQQAEVIDLEDYMDEVKILREICERFMHLLSIFDCDESDLDGYLISALLSSAGMDTPSDMLNLEQLEIAIRLNRADIARDKIFLDDKKWKKNSLDQFMIQVILNDQDEFVNLLIEQGLRLEDFLSVHTLENLYTECLKRVDSKTELIAEIWEAERIYKMDWVMLRDVGKIIKNLIGDFYEPLYLSKKFLDMVIEKGYDPYISSESDNDSGSDLSIWSSDEEEQSKKTVSSRGSSKSDEEKYASIPKNLVSLANQETDLGSSSSDNENIINNDWDDTNVERSPNMKIILKSSSTRVQLPTNKANRIQNSQSRLNYSIRSKLNEDSSGRRNFIAPDPGERMKTNPNETILNTTCDSQGFLQTQSSLQTFNEMKFQIAQRITSKGSFSTSGQGTRKSKGLDEGIPNAEELMDKIDKKKLAASQKARQTGNLIKNIDKKDRKKLKKKEKLSKKRLENKKAIRAQRRRWAKGELTLIERITGAGKRMHFEFTRQIMLERPARELMIMCILVGKIDMAHIFWAIEKEPMAAALLASILLGQLCSLTDDLTDKEDFEALAKQYEEDAEGVLNECYEEDSDRALMLVYRKLNYYGGTSAIRLAARGECIRFISHPCCQDLLSEVWMGELSVKNGMVQMVIGMALGLIFPLIIPQVMRYGRQDAAPIPSAEPKPISKEDNDSKHEKDSLDEILKVSDDPLGMIERAEDRVAQQAEDIYHFYCAPVTRFVYNTVFYFVFLLVFSYAMLTRSSVDIDYLDYFIGLMVFSFLAEETKQALDSSLSDYLADGWNQLDVLAIVLYICGSLGRLLAYLRIKPLEGTLLLNDNIPENFTSIDVNSTLHPYIQFRWGISSLSEINSSILEALPTWANESEENLLAAMWGVPKEVIEDYIEPPAYNGPAAFFYILDEYGSNYFRIFYAFSLFAFWIRLMYIFSFSIVLGPKLIMISRIVVNDMLPFMMINTVLQLGYGAAFQVISYGSGYYFPYIHPDLKTKEEIMAGANYTRIPSSNIYYDVVLVSLIQMFGDFGVDRVTGTSSQCTVDNRCPTYTGRYLSAFAMGIFIMITQNLMINLLIANLTATYTEIEGSSSYFWSFQRYEMIQEFVERPNLAPPLVLIWYTYELLEGILSSVWRFITCRSKDEEPPEDPFCRDMKRNQTLESKLLKWENMKAIIFLRNQAESEGGGGRGAAGRKTGASLVFRGGKGGGKRGGDGQMPIGNLLEGITKIFGPETEFIEERFKEAGQQFARLGGFEERLEKITTQIKKIITNISNVAKTQNRINTLLKLVGGKRLVGLNKKHRDELIRQNREIQRAREKLFEEMQKQKHVTVTGINMTLLPGNINSTTKLQESSTTHLSQTKTSRHETPVKLDQDLLIVEKTIRTLLEQAIEGLGIHCEFIEEKIIEKIQTEELCVKAILTRSKEIKFDPDKIIMKDSQHVHSRNPKALRFSTGQLVERTVLSHRLFKIVPFNFESYSGIRVNVPPDKTSWKEPYQLYKPYKAMDERLFVVYKSMEDPEHIKPEELKYNCYDEVNGVSRHGLRHRVKIARPNFPPCGSIQQGLPLNPYGRSGLIGRGLLPRWGPNHAIVVALTRKSVTNSSSLDVILLNRKQNFCLPFFLVDHRSECDFGQCSATLIKSYLKRRINNIFTELHFKSRRSSRTAENLQESRPASKSKNLESLPQKQQEGFTEEEEAQIASNLLSIGKAKITIIEEGTLYDHLNADHAWIEAVFLNINENPQYPFSNYINELFEEDFSDERAIWSPVLSYPGMRQSHEGLISSLLSYHL